MSTTHFHMEQCGCVYRLIDVPDDSFIGQGHELTTPCPSHRPDPVRTETDNRVAVAIGLADVLAAHGATPDEARRLPTTGWRMAAALLPDAVDREARNPDYSPSPATRAAAIAVLVDRADHPDPFDGFPS